ncbi:MAG: hypothetical protein A2Z98_12485 [Spirochaetes bacterium GWB1_27_13]|nr:MAG: hypothetical protein A2Z98_12485 [Spirochaetes bacterium GWB1_27_13]
MINKKQIAYIHILKNNLAISEKKYREILQFFLVNTSKDLPEEQYTFFISKMKELSATTKQLNTIHFLAKNIVTNLKSYCEHITQRKILNLSFLRKEEASLIITSLQKYKK